MIRRTIRNAFNESAATGRSAPTADVSTERPLVPLADMRIELARCGEDWRLSLCPILPLDALRALPKGGSPAVMDNLLLLDPDSAAGDGCRAVVAVAERMGIGVVERFGPDRLVLKDGALHDLVSAAKPRGFRVVRVAGPIELRDASAIGAAFLTGRSPLDVELRATTSLTARADSTAELLVRDKGDALRFAAENFRHYLAAVRDEPANGFEAPHIDQLERLLDISGTLTLRPIETRCFATFIDVGLGTQAESTQAPATQSLIYDLPSQSWHDEP